MGDVQAANAEPSSRHSNVVPSMDENLRSAVVALVKPGGALSIVVSGGLESTVHVYCTGIGSTLLYTSTARARTVCGPCSRTLNVVGEVQAEYGPASSRHSNRDPGPGSDDANANVAALLVDVSGGADCSVVSGAVVSVPSSRATNASAALK